MLGRTLTGRAAAGSRKQRITLSDLRAAWWALRAVRRTRRGLRGAGLDGTLALPSPPQLPPEAERGVRAVLRRTRNTCVVRSIVLQAWHAAHGDRRDLIVGVTAPGSDFAAHAWLEGDPPHADEPFHELLRRPVR